MSYFIKAVGSFFLCFLFLFSHYTFAQQQILTGNVILPSGVANGAIQIDINVDLIDSFGTPRTTFSTTATIADQARQGTYSIDLDPLTNGDSYVIRYGCDATNVSNNCENLLDNTLYSDSGPTYDSFSAQQFSQVPNNLDLALLESDIVATGTVTLNGEIATQGMDVLVTAKTFRSFQGSNFEFMEELVSSNSDVVTISANSTGADFSVLFPDVSNLRYELSYVCQNNCDSFSTDPLVISDGFSFNGFENIETSSVVEVLNANLSSVSGQPGINRNSLDSALELPLFRTQTLSGNIILPVGNTDFFDGQAFGLTVNTYNASDELIAISRIDDVVISNGQTSGAYSIVVPTVNNGYNEIIYGCPFLGFSDTECGTFVEQVFYNQNGPELVEADAEEIILLPANLDLPMLQGLLFEYTVDLESGTAASDYSVFAFVSAFTTDGEFIGSNHVDFQNEASSILQGESSAGVINRLGGIPPLDSGEGYYLIGFSCFECGDVIRLQYYTAAGTVFDLAVPAAQIAPADFPDSSISGNTTTVSLRRGNVLSGEVSLPADNTASGFLSLNVKLESLNASGEVTRTDSGSVFFDIDGGSTTASYSITYPDDGVSSYRLVAECSSDCGNIAPATYFTTDGITNDTSTNIDDANITSSNLPTSADFALETIQVQAFNFQVRVPQALTSGALAVNVFVTPIDADGNSEFDQQPFPSFDIQIEQGQTLSPILQFELPVSQSGNYNIQFFCDRQLTLLNCTNYLGNTPNSNFELSQDAIPEVVFLDLIEGVPLTFRNVGEFGATIPDVSIAAVVALDAQGNVVGNQQALVFTELDDVQNTHAVIPAPVGGSYEVFYLCVDELPICPGIINGASILLETLPATFLELPFFNRQSLNFQAQLPEANDSGNVSLKFRVQARDSSSDVFFDDDRFVAEVRSGSLVSDTLPDSVPALPVGGSYIIDVACEGSNCDDYVANDPSYRITINQGDVIPDPITGLLVLVPEIIEPDAFEVDDTPETASVIRRGQRQRHTIHVAGDVDFARFTLVDSEEGEPTTNIRIEALANAPTSNLQVTLRDSNGVVIAQHDDEQDTAEASSLQLSSIDVASLMAGDYTIEVTAFSPAEEVDGYTLRLTYDGDDEFCFPIVVKNGGAVVICL